MARKPRKRKKSRPARARRAAIGSKSNGASPLIWASALLALVFGVWHFSGAPANQARAVPSLGNRHIPVGASGTVAYNTDPPTSGPHYPTIVRWGVHEKPIARGFQVHNLEDGGVLVQYNCGDCPDLVEKLEGIARRYPKFVVLAPYPSMKHRIALTAWGRIDTLETFDEARVTGFIKAFKGIDHHPRR